MWTSLEHPNWVSSAGHPLNRPTPSDPQTQGLVWDPNQSCRAKGWSWESRLNLFLSRRGSRCEVWGHSEGPGISVAREGPRVIVRGPWKWLCERELCCPQLPTVRGVLLPLLASLGPCSGLLCSGCGCRNTQCSSR